ncbi:DUF4430 domain-containing protein [Brevibacillus sp. SYP-B805]|uniref:DUF4430 domain-containing protein n=1 Tax=Brevibacillus sp. SYP-B805 TaxID=1578199 RepID=UPI0013ED1911|nr:DUF4430 domain-containing protein [Brevibacillus sp. SYP-B805]NGQ96257.1 DUF4430 domain-containing protein [Brevibacillus sp. SYP-B805]
MWKRLGKWLAVLLLLTTCTMPPVSGIAAQADAALEAEQSGSTVTISGHTGADDPPKVALLVVDAQGQTVYFQDVAGGGASFRIQFQPAETASNGKAVATLYSRTPVSDTFSLKAENGEEKKIGVTLRIEGFDKEEILAKSGWSIKKGSSVYDLLVYAAEENELDVEVSDPDGDGHDLYVKSIAGLAEFDKGPGSGWVYKVNGVGPQAPVDRYVLEDGDDVEWLYTSDYGNTEIGDGSGQDRIAYRVSNKDAVNVEKALNQLTFAEDVETIARIAEDLFFDLAEYSIEKQRGFVADVGLFLQAACERAATFAVPKKESWETTRVIELPGEDAKKLLAAQAEFQEKLQEMLESSTLYKPLLKELKPTLLIGLPSDQETTKYQILVDREAWEAMRQAGARLGIARGNWRTDLLLKQPLTIGADPFQLTVQFYDDQEQTAQVEEIRNGWTGTLQPLTASYRLESSMAGAVAYQINWPLTGVPEEGGWPSLYVRTGGQAGWQAATPLVTIEEEKAKAVVETPGDMVVMSAQASFQDVLDAPAGYAWAREPVQALAAVGVVKGKSPLRFGLTDTVTRQEFAAMLARISEKEAVGEQRDDGAGISRLEIASRLAQAYGGGGSIEPLRFTDLQMIPELDREAVALCTSHGWMLGRADGRFDPQAVITRAEAAAVLYRFWRNVQTQGK